MALAADHQVVVDGDPQRLGRFLDLARHLDVAARGLGIATGMIVDPPPLVQIPLSLRCMLYPLPFTTFGEIAALGLEAEVHCSSCYRQTKVDLADGRLSDRVFAAARSAAVASATAALPCRSNLAGHPDLSTSSRRCSCRLAER